MVENLNMNFNESLVIETLNKEWAASPSPNVLRIPLERKSQESGHTTSFVQYLPNSSFDAHSHPLGEEIFVLDGTFSDNYGDYPQGTYLRNPPGSSHAPFSKDGCILFVKLNQFEPDDLQQVLIDTNKTTWRPGFGNLEVMPLHEFGTSSTALVKWPKGEKFARHRHHGGEEILVLSGEFKDENGNYPQRTWIRSKHLSEHHPWVDEETLILVKTGHLLI
jgi:anti-sigma factor ChrR (cupin superfamily)